MKFDLAATDLALLNSMTKYPSIPTYHALDPKNGSLGEPAIAFEGDVIGTEKVDGANSRIILTPDHRYLIGSREELLHADGDLIANPALGIVAALKDTAERLRQAHPGGLAVYFLEAFGGRITGASKEYTACGAVGLRLFDVVDIEDPAAMLTKPAAQIAAWRDNGGQAFRCEHDLQLCAAQKDLTLTPRLFRSPAAKIPNDLAGMHAFLMEKLPGTLCKLDPQAAGRPEGIVLRSADRSAIAKARFQDYERTFRSARQARPKPARADIAG